MNENQVQEQNDIFLDDESFDFDELEKQLEEKMQV